MTYITDGLTLIARSRYVDRQVLIARDLAVYGAGPLMPSLSETRAFGASLLTMISSRVP